LAQECLETKDGLTIWEDHFYPEIVDPQTGAVLPEGEQGELVFTWTWASPASAGWRRRAGGAAWAT
jgi:hypothetical protein